MTEKLPINPVPVSIKFQIASNLAKLLEVQNRPGEWNFPDAVTLEIHENLLRQIDRGEGAELINQFVAVGGEINDSDFQTEARINSSVLLDSPGVLQLMKPELETQQYLQQFFEKDAETIQNWFEAACIAHPNPPFGYEGLKANTGFLIITFGALQSFLEAGKTIEDYIAAQRTPVNLK